MRFMWIPFEDAVVVVTNNPTFDGVLGEGQGGPSPYSDDEKVSDVRGASSLPLSPWRGRSFVRL